MAFHGPDRRGASRATTRLEAVISSGTFAGSALVVDLSTTGLLVVCHRELAVGTQLGLTIDGVLPPVYVQGKVVRRVVDTHELGHRRALAVRITDTPPHWLNFCWTRGLAVRPSSAQS